MRKIVIGRWVLGALVVSGCNKPSGSGGEAPTSSASSNSTAAPPATSSPSSAKTEPRDKDEKAGGPKDHLARTKMTDEAFSAHDAKKFAALFAEDGVIKTPGEPDIKGHDAIEKDAEKTFAAFKDCKLTHGRIWAKDKHTAVYEWIFTGTNTADAPEMGIPKATNKPVGIMGATWAEIGDDGLIKESHRYRDIPTLMGQLAPDPRNPVRAVVTAPDGTEERGDGPLLGSGEEIAKAVEKEEKKNIELENKLTGLLNEHKVDDALKLTAENILFVDYTRGADVKGKKAFKDMLGMYFTAFPDMRGKIRSGFGDRDYAVMEFEYMGTQKGAFGPIKATNKPVHLHQLEVDLITDSKVVRGWAWGNNVELLTELGVMKEPGAALAPAPSSKPPKP
jgi:steroid delta-isomerase-like uncharacterized protein